MRQYTMMGVHLGLHRYFSPKTDGKPSKIYGVGVFAIERIAEGERVATLGGNVVSKSNIEKYWARWGHIGIQVDTDSFLVPPSRELEARGFFNHSCVPNVGFRTSVTLVAMRNVERGEELVFDYAFNETFFEPFVCKCGAKNCRKKIGPDDWKREEIQERYAQYYSPYLR